MAEGSGDGQNSNIELRRQFPKIVITPPPPESYLGSLDSLSDVKMDEIIDDLPGDLEKNKIISKVENKIGTILKAASVVDKGGRFNGHDEMKNIRKTLDRYSYMIDDYENKGR